MPRAKRIVADRPIELPVYRRGPAHGLAALSRDEWLLTNGIGGFALGTPLGTPTRRYHGLLVGATAPPVGRVVALSAVCEWAECGGERYDLAAFHWAGGDFLPPALPHFDGFELDQGARAARWRWRLGKQGSEAAESGEVILRRELTLVEGANAAVIRYSAPGAGVPVRVVARPLLALRDFHWVLREGDDPERFRLSANEGGMSVESHGLRLEMNASGARFHAEPDWWRNFFYQRDHDRGQECVEDLWCPGFFEMELGGPRRQAVLIAWLGDVAPKGRAGRAKRLQALGAAAIGSAEANAAGAMSEGTRRDIAALAASSDDFLVRRGTKRTADVSIIAGYPWFSDWGRDTMICIPGLLLATGRHDEALSTLRAFAKHRKNGIIPNRFDDSTGGAHYNTVDASLWFLHACCEYARGAKDSAGFLKHLLPACRDVVDAYAAGTDYNIRVDGGLVAAGDATTQLTWMDAQRDGVVFTPRHGKCVEINALWYSGLIGVAELLRKARRKKDADALDALARDCKKAFAAFWWAEGHDGQGCLYDRLAPDDASEGGWRPVGEVRPNQVFAVSLPHSPISREKARAVVRCVRERLLTPCGLRTLDPADPNYRPRFSGPLPELDAAYHNGTVWPWLLGPFAEAVMRVKGFSEASKREARDVVRPIIERTDAPPGGAGGECLGHIAEVFDGEDTPNHPQQPGGCPAQAWSLAEALRISILAAG